MAKPQTIQFNDTMSVSIHTHTTASIYDSVASPEQLIKRAKELGCQSLAITDHGVMFNTYDCINLGKENGINIIPGVEGYVKEGAFRRHIVILPKDEQGFHQLCKLVTESNMHQEYTKVKNKTATYPLMDKSMIAKYFAEGTLGHDHAIMTTACVGGVCCNLFSENDKNKKEYEKVWKSLNDYANNPYHQLEKEVATLGKQKDKLKEARDFSLTGIKKNLTAIKNSAGETSAEYQRTFCEFEEKRAKKEAAAIQYKEISSAYAKKKKELTAAKKKLPSVDIDTLSKRMAGLKTLVLSDAEIEKRMEDELLFYSSVFGKENTYAEIQYHGLPIEAKAYPALVRLAKKHGIAIVASNDVHMVTPEQENARAISRSLRFDFPVEHNADDKEYYLKTDRELAYALSAIFPQEIVYEAINNTHLIGERCLVELKPEHHYPKYKSNSGLSSEEELRKLTYEGVYKKFNEKTWTKEYADRLEYELSVICQMGYADYHLIVADFLDIGRKIGRLDEEHAAYFYEHAESMSLQEFTDYLDKYGTGVGLSIGPGRGSAAGSLVCFVLGITSIDPIKNGLLFERFLNTERVSMPDIDSDMDIIAREYIIMYVRKKYGEHAVCSILTKTKVAPKGAIRSAAASRATEVIDQRKLTGADAKKAKGYYLDLADAMAKKVPEDLHVTFKDCETAIMDAYGADAEAMTVYENAKSLAGIITSTSMHAAGIIISDNDNVAEYLPLTWNEENKKWVAQCDMVQSEENGMLKMDFLGLRNLNIAGDVVKMIYRYRGMSVDIENIPLDDTAVYRDIYANGNTIGVFQVEGGGMTEMLKRLKPTCFEDIVLAVAAYRPGPMQYLDDIIKVKNGEKALTYLTPELEPILSNTYGAIIYQEQVQQIFQRLAGYSLGQADIVRRAMSKKKDSVLAAERVSFVNGDPKRGIKGCVANGISAEIANTLFDQMTEFAKYAFNKSHAAAYAKVSYITAYEKKYFPSYFYCATLNHTDKIEKAAVVIKDAKKNGVEILPPDINESKNSFTIKEADGKEKVLYGFQKIKGASAQDAVIKERTEHGYFRNFKDFAMRCPVTADTEALVKTGAFDKIDDRTALFQSFEMCKKYKEEMNKALANIQKYEMLLKIRLEARNFAEYLTKASEAGYELKIKTLPTTASLEKKLELAKYTYQNCLADFNDMELFGINSIDNDIFFLSEEQKYLGASLSKDPFSLFEHESDHEKLVLISDYREVYTKKDSRAMAFFTVTDENGKETGAVCFPDSFAALEDKSLLHEGAMIVINKNDLKKDKDGNDQYVINSPHSPKTSKEDAYICTDSSSHIHLNDLIAKIEDNYEKGGHRVYFKDNMTGDIMKTCYEVNDQFFEKNKNNEIER